MAEEKIDDENCYFDDSRGCLIHNQLRGHDLVFEVQNIISNYRQKPFPDFDTVAQVLQIQPRVLRRLLKSESTNFQDIKDNVRCEMAKFYLKNTHKKVGQIALIVGFSNTGAFHRAFRAWTGKTPTDYRQDESSV